MSKWKYGILFLILGAVGCTSIVEPLPAPELKVEKPPVPWPAPVSPTCMNSFKFERIDGKVWAMVDYQDYIKFSKGLVTKERFTRDLISMVCYYQPDPIRCKLLEK